MSGKSPNKKKRTTRKNKIYQESKKQQIKALIKELSRRKILKEKREKKRKTGKREKGKKNDNSDNINDLFHPDKKNDRISKSKDSITLTELNELLNKAKPLTDKNKIYQESEKQQFMAHLKDKKEAEEKKREEGEIYNNSENFYDLIGEDDSDLSEEDDSIPLNFGESMDSGRWKVLKDKLNKATSQYKSKPSPNKESGTESELAEEAKDLYGGKSKKTRKRRNK
jgi:hypothetical protein